MINTKNGKLTPWVVSRRDTAVSVSGLKSSNRYGKIKRVGVFSPFLYLYDMKLLNQLAKVILENRGREYRPTVLFSNMIDNRLIQLLSTKHQRVERFGNQTYDDLVDMYNEFVETRKSKFQKPPRIAVPDMMVKDFFESNLMKIYYSFEDENPENKQIIFVKKRKDNEDDKVFSYIEVLLKKEGNFFYIITSAFSKDGQFLMTDVEEKKSNRVRLEARKNNNILVIYL